MASLTVFDQAGKEVGKYEIEPADLAPTINKQLLHDAVVMYQANKRQGSHKTKSRAEVKSSRKKMYRQKGTGNARAGHRTSGVRRGGGHIFAKRNRDYGYRLPRRALKLATRMALASKIQDEEMIVLDSISMSEPKTKEMATMLKAIGADSTALIATESIEKNVYMSARNIQGVSVVPVSDLNALSVLQPRRVVVTKAALESLKSQVEEKA